MNIHWYMSPKDARNFANSCEAVIRNVDRGTKAATEQACREVLEESLKQVPRDTGTLASTAFYEVSRRTARKGYVYEGTIGYAGAAGAGFKHDAVNPRTGKPASSYAIIVHEDLTVAHPGGGKAKFLEDPLRAYAANRFARVAEAHWAYAIESTSSGGQMILPTEV